MKKHKCRRRTTAFSDFLVALRAMKPWPGHAVFGSFKKKFMKSVNPPTYRGKGYKFTTQIEKWAEKHPESVHIVKLDDISYSTSKLVFIDHNTKLQWHGTTAIFLPQCTNEAPTAMFMYPRNVDALIKTLCKIRAKARKLQEGSD